MKQATLAVLMLAVLCMTGCDDDSSGGGTKTEDPTSYGSLCVNSGGVFEKGSCVCSGVTCDAGDVCNT